MWATRTGAISMDEGKTPKRKSFFEKLKDTFD